MKVPRIVDAMNYIDDALVSGAEVYKPKKMPIWVKWGGIAACLCLCALLGVSVWQSDILNNTPPSTQNKSADGAPQFTLNGKTYMISPHHSLSETLPDGFVYAGTVNIVGVGDNISYYTNADMPEWVYAYQEVHTTGEVDETGTLIPTEPRDAYVRYVILPLRGRDLLCCDGKIYVSMWSVGLAVDEDYYNAIREKYGVRIEGTAPDGFSLVRTAEFSGYDTVPDGALSLNTNPAEVYLSEAEPDIALVATEWYTAPDGTGEIRHNGFNVYIHWLYGEGNWGYDLVAFDGELFYKADLSEDTLKWLEWYNSLPKEEQLAVSYIPADLYTYDGAGTEDAKPNNYNHSGG